MGKATCALWNYEASQRIHSSHFQQLREIGKIILQRPRTIYSWRIKETGEVHSVHLSLCIARIPMFSSSSDVVHLYPFTVHAKAHQKEAVKRQCWPARAQSQYLLAMSWWQRSAQRYHGVSVNVFTKYILQPPEIHRGITTRVDSSGKRGQNNRDPFSGKLHQKPHCVSPRMKPWSEHRHHKC